MSLVGQESRPSTVFGIIALFRAGQGLAVGIMFVIVQVTVTTVILLSLKPFVISVAV